MAAADSHETGTLLKYFDVYRYNQPNEAAFNPPMQINAYLNKIKFTFGDFEGLSTASLILCQMN